MRPNLTSSQLTLGMSIIGFLIFFFFTNIPDLNIWYRYQPIKDHVSRVWTCEEESLESSIIKN